LLNNNIISSKLQRDDIKRIKIADSEANADKGKKSKARGKSISKSRPKAEIESKKPFSFFKTDDEIAETKENEESKYNKAETTDKNFVNKNLKRNEETTNLEKDITNCDLISIPNLFIINKKTQKETKETINNIENFSNIKTNKPNQEINNLKLKYESEKNNSFKNKKEIKSKQNPSNEYKIRFTQANSSSSAAEKLKETFNRQPFKKMAYKEKTETENENKSQKAREAFEESNLNLSSVLVLKKQKTFQSDIKAKPTAVVENEYEISSFDKLNELKIYNNNNNNNQENKRRKKENGKKNNKNKKTEKKSNEEIKIEAFGNGKIKDFSSSDKENKNIKTNNNKKSKAVKKENSDKTKFDQNPNLSEDEHKNSFDDIELSFTEEAKNAIDTDRNSKNINYDFTSGATDNFTDFGVSLKFSDLDVPQPNKLYGFSNTSDLNSQNFSNFTLDMNRNERNNSNVVYSSNNTNTNTDTISYKSKIQQVDKKKFAFYKGNKNTELKANTNNNNNQGTTNSNKTILESDNELERTNLTNNKKEDNNLAEERLQLRNQKLNKLIINPNDHFSMSYEDSESANEVCKILNKNAYKGKIENLELHQFSQSPSEELSDNNNKSNKKSTKNNKNNNKKNNKRNSNNQSQTDCKSLNNILTISTSNQQNPNAHITDQLEKILEYHIEHNETFETLAYRRAISQLKNTKEKISEESQLAKYKYLGKSLKQKIKEILATGTIKKLDFLKNDEKNIAINKLKTVHGIGLQFANKLYIKGFRSIEDLRRNQDLLTQTQKIGLKYYEDLIKRIPRSECEQIFSRIKKTACQIIPESALQIELCGSYRRCKQSIGDLDVLLTVTDSRSINGILSALVEKLYEAGLIKETLSLSREEGELRKHSFMGICRLNGNPHRRIDIKVYEKDAFPFALLYFTGSAYFNRSLRLYAKKQSAGIGI